MITPLGLVRSVITIRKAVTKLLNWNAFDRFVVIEGWINRNVRAR